jgi:hypothetical protein
MILACFLKLACYAAISEALYLSTAFFVSSNFLRNFLESLNRKALFLTTLHFSRASNSIPNFFKFVKVF